MPDTVPLDPDTRPTAGLRRRARADGERSRQMAISACRTMMMTGNFRPAIGDFARFGVSRKIVQRHFQHVGQLYRAALQDEGTRTALLHFLMPNGPWPAADDCSRIIDAVVMGRVRP